MTKWNPARELNDLIERGLAVNASHSTEQAWKELFSANQLEELIGVLDAVIKLPGHVRLMVESLDDPDEEQLLLTGLAQIENVLRQQELAQPWSNVASRLEALAVPRAHLRHAAAAIRRYGREVDLEEGEIQALQESLDGVVASVEESNLPRNLRLLLVAQLRDVRSALSRIAMLGPEAASMNIDRVIGTLVTIQDTPDLPQKPLQIIVKWIRRALIVVNIARIVMGIEGIGPDIGNALPDWFDPPQLPPGGSE